jgi:ubiquinone/menaquinone biosynthesis C-methylase UbiE
VENSGKHLDPVLKRELEYHERLYSGAAQEQFSKPAVVEFRRHLVSRILQATHAGPGSRVLSLGCGIGDTELLLAPRVGHVTGIDLSREGIRHARLSAEVRGARNTEFINGLLEEAGFEDGSFDVVIAVFFLHHLVAHIEADLPPRIFRLLKPGGAFYSLDPSRYRLSGFVGKLLFPALMKKYQTEDEEELAPTAVWSAFSRAGFRVTESYYDFVSTPLAGLLPSWKLGYRVARATDELLIRLPVVKRLSSNFEVVAVKSAP